mgnify:CR=1 FL=1
MARKTLLTEGEVRQFMKLASLGGLTETYFSSNHLEERDEEEELGDELGATEDELGAEDDLADEEGDELDAMDMDMGGEEGNEDLLARVVQAVADELGVEVDVEGAGEEGGEELEVDAELEEPLPGGGEEEFEMGAEEEVELPGNRGSMYQENHEIDESGTMVGDMSRQATRKPAVQRAGPPRDPSTACRPGQHWNAELKQCDPGEEKSGALDQDAIVAEVARRVAARLNGAKRQEAVAAQLAERIFDRLTSK